jgi:predicted Zn finger-like uncharacterized protein
MIIQCPQCQSRFKLPLEKAKAGGTKVRCTKCKSIFFITPPGTPEAAADKNPGAKANEDWADFYNADKQESGISDPEKESVDYFGDNFDAAEFFAQGDGDDNFFLNGEPAPEGILDEGTDVSFPQITPASGPIDSGDDLPKVENAAPPDIRQEVFSEPPQEQDAEERMPGLSLAEEEPPPPPMDFSRDVKLSHLPSIPESLPDSVRRKPSSAGPLLVLLLLLILSAGGFFLYQQDLLPDNLQPWKKKQQVLPEAADLRLGEVSGYHETNSREGSLFVVTGKVVNHGLEARAGIQVSGFVNDRSGTTIARQAAYCGNPFSRSELHSLSFERMAERMNNQFGEVLSNINIEPGKSVPFVIVFRGVPEEVAEFGVEVVDSKPVAK